jgi:hypothetical protein
MDGDNRLADDTRELTGTTRTVSDSQLAALLTAILPIIPAHLHASARWAYWRAVRELETS